VNSSNSPGPRLWRHLRNELKQLDRRLRPLSWYRAYIPEVLRKLVRLASCSVHWFTERPVEPPRPSDADRRRQSNLRRWLMDASTRIVFPGHPEPLVSIIILSYNRADQLLECLESVRNHTNDVPYEMIIADNASTDSAIDVLKHVDNATVLRERENLGFIRGNNQAARMARGRYLLFLNNDTIVTPRWLSSLVETMETYPDCGVVGPKFLYPDGRLQEAGIICWSNGHVDQCGIHGDPLVPEFQHVREVDYVSGACLLIRTDVFRRLGGFDERYVPCYYEDSDLCFGVRSQGQCVVYQPASVIFHHGPSAAGLARTEAHCAANRQKFVMKWADALRHRIKGQMPGDLILARDIRPGLRVLLIDAPTSNAADELADQGCVVTFVPRGRCDSMFRLRQRGIEVLPGDDAAVLALMTKRLGCFETVVVGSIDDREQLLELARTRLPLTPRFEDVASAFRFALQGKRETQSRRIPAA
jgi:GT2 family glycosyltransferase